MNALITKVLQSRLTCLTISVSVFLLHVILAFICDDIDSDVLRMSFIIIYPWPAALTYILSLIPGVGRIGLWVAAVFASIEIYIYIRCFLLGMHWKQNAIVLCFILFLAHGAGVIFCEVVEGR